MVGFTAHNVVAADVDPDWVHSILPPGSLSAPMSARFLAALADRVGAEPGAYDAVLVAPDRPVPLPGLTPVDEAESPRLRRAERYRVDVRAWTVEGAILIVGRGLAGRWEVSLEVDPAYRGRGIGRPSSPPPPPWSRRASRCGRRSSPANVASLRMFLAAGYRPVAAEVLFA